MRLQLRRLQRRGHHHFLVAALAQRMAEEVDHRAVARVLQAVAVSTDAVEAGDEAQVLDRACAQQGLPRVCAGRGPRSEEHTSELQSLMRSSYAVFCLKTKKQIALDTAKKHMRV